MIEKKEKSKLILELYLDKKLSMAQIAKKFSLSSSTIRYWLDKNGVKRRSINEAINSWYFTKFNKKSFQIKEALGTELENLKTSGVMLYWGEGAKTGNVVKFVNSDPEMIRIFLRFLREICGIHEERLKALIHLYPDHDENEVKSFWINLTKINKNNFYKSNIHQGKKGTYKNKSKWGTIAINYPDKRLIDLLLKWINDYKNRY